MLATAPQRANTENSKQIFPEKELRSQSPNCYIHVSVSDLYIPTIDLPTVYCCRKYGFWEYINSSQTHECGIFVAVWPKVRSQLWRGITKVCRINLRLIFACICRKGSKVWCFLSNLHQILPNFLFLTNFWSLLADVAHTKFCTRLAIQKTKTNIIVKVLHVSEIGYWPSGTFFSLWCVERGLDYRKSKQRESGSKIICTNEGVLYY